MRRGARKADDHTMTTITAPDYTAIKARQQGTWSSGDYAVIGTTLQIVGETLCEAVDIAAGEDVLDVAAGNGNASLAAARRGASVVASDYVGSLLEGTLARAAAEGLSIEAKEADAEALPFADASFDVVLSTFGVMFTPNQEQSASELVRVCRPGGRIGLANWTPDGFVGEMFKVVGRYVAPPAGIQSPVLWGTEDRLHELLGDRCSKLQIQRKDFVFRYRSAEDWVDTFREFYGPTHKAFGALDAAAQSGLEQDLLTLAREHNSSASRGLRIASSYLEVVATV
jgi:SAM-dependent methyltransferase